MLSHPVRYRVVGNLADIIPDAALTSHFCGVSERIIAR